MPSEVGVGVGVFVLKTGTFVMGRRVGRHGAGAWSLPGGRLEFGETFEAAASREVFEETGLEVGGLRVVALSNDVFVDEGLHFITVWLLGDWHGGELRVREPHAFRDLGWYRLDQLPRPLFLPWRNLFVSPDFQVIRRLIDESSRNSS